MLRHPLVAGTHATYGWCCGNCHPTDHLKPDQIRREPAPEPTGPQLEHRDAAFGEAAPPTRAQRRQQA